MTFFFFKLSNKERIRACRTRNRGSNLHTQLSRPGAPEHGGNKEKTDANDFFLTKTIANLSSSSPASGMGSFRGMLCPLRSVWWSMLPAFPMIPLLTRNPNFFPSKSTWEKKNCTAIKRGNIRTLFALLSRPGRILAGLSRSLLLLQHKAHVREVT